MTKGFANFTQGIREQSNVADRFLCYGKTICVFTDFSVSVDGIKLEEEFKSLEEAKRFIRKYVYNNKIIESIDTDIPNTKVANYIKQYHNIDKVKDTLIESYLELASSGTFSVDPVITEIKKSQLSTFANKIEYVLEDNTKIAIDVATQELLNNLLKNKNEVVTYMRENKTNFMAVLRGVI